LTLNGSASITISGSNEVASQVIDITFHVHQELLFLSFNLNPSEALSSEFIWVINVNDIFPFFSLYLLLFLDNVRAIFKPLSNEATHHLLRKFFIVYNL
jgi:hypothetical protein